MRKITPGPSVLGLGLGLVATAASLALTAGPAAGAAAPVVHETLIDPGSADSYAEAINNHGDVVGTDDSGAFLADASGVHGLTPPAGAEATLPTAINDRGDILAQTLFGPDQTYLWRGGHWTFIADGDPAGLN